MIMETGVIRRPVAKITATTLIAEVFTTALSAWKAGYNRLSSLQFHIENLDS